VVTSFKTSFQELYFNELKIDFESTKIVVFYESSIYMFF